MAEVGDGRLRRSIATLAVGAVWLVFLLWLVGWSLTDRTAWTQWLWWLHWGAWALIASLPAAVASLAGRTRLPWAAAGLILLAGLHRDIGWRGSGAAPPPGSRDISIVHWNAGWPDSEAASEPSRRLRSWESDVVLLSNPYRIFNDGRIERWRNAGYDIVIPGVFAIASRLPILEARTILGSSDGAAAWFVLDARASLGRTLGVLVIDLPSDPRRSRAGVAERFRRSLDAAGFDERTGPGGVAVDLIVGDFNIPRGSASLSTVAPRHRHAWNDGGRGWGASWPRRRPWLHIDNALLGDGLAAADYRLVDLGAGEHLAQRIRVHARRGTPTDE